MKARMKAKEVEAVRHVGPNTLVVVGKKGEQRAQPGDVILITGDKPQDREVISAKDFADSYEMLDDDGEVLNSEPSGNDYGVPHFDTVEQAQAAAMEHYKPESQTDEFGDIHAKPKSSEPFICTIGDKQYLQSIQPNGVVAQVPVAPQDPTRDPGFGTPYGYADQHFPSTIANQGADIREGAKDGLPVSQYQRGTGAEETPAQTQGNTLEQPNFTPPDVKVDHDEDEPTEENTAPEGSPHAEK